MGLPLAGNYPSHKRWLKINLVLSVALILVLKEKKSFYADHVSLNTSCVIIVVRRREIIPSSSAQIAIKLKEVLVLVRGTFGIIMIIIMIYFSVVMKSSVLVHLDSRKQAYKDTLERFQKEWVKLTPKCPTPPTPQAIFAIQNKQLTKSFHEYSDRIKQGDQKATNSDLFFHGTKLTCNLLENKDCCKNSDCGVCGISSDGFDDSRIGSNIPRFQRFGKGIYLAPNSSKCHDYTQGNPLHNVRAQLLCLVSCGAKYELRQDNTTLTGPPEQYHSVHGVAGGSLNYDEIVVFDVAAVLPQFIIVYELGGVEKIAK